MSVGAVPAPETPAAPAEGETPVVEGETPAVETPAAPQTPEEKAAAEVAAAAAAREEAKKAIPEDVLKEAAEEHAKAALKQANATMAAARRAEARVETLKTENTKLAGENTTFREFVTQLRAGDPTALRRAGFASVKAYLEAVSAFGGEPAAPSAEDRVTALEKQIKDREAKAALDAANAAVEASKQAVFAAVDKSDAHPYVATKQGKATLWANIEAYYEEHGQCPDEAVWRMADLIEQEMEADQGPAAARKTSGKANPAKNGAAPSGTLNAGKTLTGKGPGGAPSVKEYSMDPEVRRKQVLEDMRAAGELR